MRDSFSGYHPAVGFLFFTLVLLFTMFLFHPVFLFLSLAGAVSYAVYLNGKKAARLLLMLLPLLLITAGIGAAFNHEGVTILAYFRNGNPLTLESIAAGLAAAVMLVAAVCWFSCYSAVMTTDKFLYLFGRVIPALSLLFLHDAALCAAAACAGQDHCGRAAQHRARHKGRQAPAPGSQRDAHPVHSHNLGAGKRG